MTIRYHQLAGFAEGDFVQLKSGGPTMQIVGFLGLDANVSYPDTDREFCVVYHFFPLACLKKI